MQKRGGVINVLRKLQIQVSDSNMLAKIGFSSKDIQINALQNEVLFLKKQIQTLNICNEELNQIAVRDPLTGVFNRIFLNGIAKKIIANEVRHKRSWAFLMVDIDRFKKINDLYGHAVGDDILRNVTQGLQDISRDGDFIIRYGGDEFCIILLDVVEENIEQIVERYCNAISATPTKCSQKTIYVTSSVGTCFVPHDSLMDLDTVLEHADKALYCAKKLGRDCMVIYAEDCTSMKK